MRIAIIAALAQNRVIGKNGFLPWHIPEDLQHFKELTLHHPVLMGRKTFESLGHPLPQRRNIVITSQKLPSIETYPSLPEALNVLQNEEIVFIIGGSMLFKEAIPLATDFYITLLPFAAEGDVFFPEYEDFLRQHFALVSEKLTPQARFVHYTRKTLP